MARRKRSRSARAATYGKGSIYQDKTGQWWYQPPAYEGRRLPRVRAASEQSAELAQADHLAKLTAKIDMNVQTVARWFNFWLKEHVSRNLKPKTLDWYRYLIEHYILPAIGDQPLDALNADHLIVLQNRLRDKLSDRTTNRIMGMINRALRRAVKSRKMLYNPCDAIDLPRVPKDKQVAWGAAEERAIKQAVAGHRLELLYDIAFLHGCRRGELLGLLISEYDPAKGTIKVSGQIQTIKGVTRRHSSPKTENGVRELPLTPRQQDMMTRHLAGLHEERARLSMDWHEHGLIFPSTVGTPMIPRNLSRHYYQALARANLPRAPFHRLRHTAATRLDMARVGASDACKAAILGHGARTVTGDYIHATSEEIRDAIERAEHEMLRAAA